MKAMGVGEQRKWSQVQISSRKGWLHADCVNLNGRKSKAGKDTHSTGEGGKKRRKETGAFKRQKGKL